MGIERFEVATAGARDLGTEALHTLDVGVIVAHEHRRAAARGETHRNGDGLAVVQRDEQITASDRVAEHRRVNNGATLADRGGGGQGHGGDIGIVVDHAGRTARALNVKLLEVATAGLGDLGRDGLAALDVGVIGAHSHRSAAARRAAHRNGDGLAVVELDDQRAASHRVVDRGGVDDRAALGDRGGGRQGHGGDIGIVVDHAGRAAQALDVEGLEVATGGAGDLGADAQGTLGVGVIGAHEPRRTVARQAALGNGDGLAVVQRDDQITSSNPVAHRSGVDDGALGDRNRGRQGHDARQRFVPHEQQTSGVKRIVLLISQPGQRQGIERPFQNEPASTRFVQRQQLLNEQLRRDGQIGSAQHHDHGCVRAQYRVGVNRQQEGAARIEQTQRVVEC